MTYSPSREGSLLAGTGVLVALYGCGLLRQPFMVARGSLLVIGAAALALGLAGCFTPYGRGDGNANAARYGAAFCLIFGVVSLIAASLPLTVWAYVVAAQSLIAGIAQSIIAVSMRGIVLLAMVLGLCALTSIALGIVVFLAPAMALHVFLACCGACFCAGGLLLFAWAASLLVAA